MSTVTESDLKELKDLIISQNQTLTESITEIKLSISELKRNINAINTRLDTYKPAIDKIPDLVEKVGELKGWRAVTLVVFSGFVTSLFWLFRTANF